VAGSPSATPATVPKPDSGVVVRKPQEIADEEYEQILEQVAAIDAAKASAPLSRSPCHLIAIGLTGEPTAPVNFRGGAHTNIS